MTWGCGALWVAVVAVICLFFAAVRKWEDDYGPKLPNSGKEEDSWYDLQPKHWASDWVARDKYN